MVEPIETRKIDRGEIGYPAILTQRLGGAAHASIATIGDVEILRRRSLGLICSIRCPGSIVIKTFDAIRELRDAGIVVAGGFHSPMEEECLDFVLRGTQPVIVCPAKGLAHTRLSASWRNAIDAGRLLLLSPFSDNVKYTRKVRAQARNEFVAALSTAVLIPHASPDGKAESVARQILGRNQPLFTFEDDENECLLQLGAKPYSIGDIRRLPESLVV